MKPKIYVETSVVSYYTGRASRDVVIAGRQQSTYDFWLLLEDRLAPYVSALVLQEAGVDFIVTWNFAHLNNPFTKMMIRQAVENQGYECPEIVTPDAFLGDET